MGKLSDATLTKIASLLWRDEEFASRYLHLIPDGTFGSYESLERLHAGLLSWRSKYGAHPTDIPAFAEFLIGGIPDFTTLNEKEAEQFIDVLIEIHGASADPATRAFAEEHLQAEIIKAQTQKLAMDALQMAQAGEFVAKDLRDLIGKLQKVEQVQVVPDLGSSVTQGLEDRQKRRLREIKRVARVPTGIEKVDQTMRGGVPGKKLCMIMGRIGKGKTASLVHFGKLAFLHGYPVLFVTLELSKEDIEDRFDAALTRTPVLELYERYERVRNRFDQWEQHFDEDIRIIEASAYRFGIPHLEAKIAECHRNDFYPKVVIVDYADLMLPERHYKDRRFELETIYVTLRRIAVENDLVVWTASQGNRQGERGVMTTANASESDAKGAISDLVLTINQSPEEKEGNLVNIFVGKSRLGRDQFLIEALTQDLETMNFFYRSEVMGTKVTPFRTFAKKKKKKGGRI